MKVEADIARCRDAGLCALTAPEVLDQDEHDGKVVVLDEEPPPEFHHVVGVAAQLCPNSVIRLEET